MPAAPHNPPISPPRQTRQAHKKRRPNYRLIKIHRPYTVDDAARATGCSKGTIRRWIRSGELPAILDKKTHLILGADLAEYLKGRAKSGPKLQLQEFFCFKCRVPREAALKMADYVPRTASTGNLKALCAVCVTPMNKVIAIASLEPLRLILDVTLTQAPTHVVDATEPSPNDHFSQEPKTNG